MKELTDSEISLKSVGNGIQMLERLVEGWGLYFTTREEAQEAGAGRFAPLRVV